MSTFFDVLDFFTIGSILAIEGLWDTAVNGPEIQPSLSAAPSTPIGAPLPERELVTNVAALPPSFSRPTPNPPSKRRRVTISGVALNMST